jgi:hypothetical protein
MLPIVEFMMDFTAEARRSAEKRREKQKSQRISAKTLRLCGEKSSIT